MSIIIYRCKMHYRKTPYKLITNEEIEECLKDEICGQLGTVFGVWTFYLLSVYFFGSVYVWWW